MSAQPAQTQDHQPGRESEMRPQPDYLPKYSGVGKLKDKVALITGAASGIGKEIALVFAAEGAKVVIADVDQTSGGELVRALAKDGHDALAIRVDVADPADAERMARGTLDHFGRIDGLVNNAALFQRPAMSRVPFEEIPVEEWDRLMAVNVRGVFLCCRAVVPTMKQQGYGKIVNISSGTVFYGAPNAAHYVTSKAGVIGLTRSLARELGAHRITVNAIAPGLTISMDEVGAARDAQNQQRLQARAIKRTELPEDIVGAAVFFCSAESDFITGQTLVVDGGAQMR
jgi:3-oxoacyl-[acyl-carrier protein] reductase